MATKRITRKQLRKIITEAPRGRTPPANESRYDAAATFATRRAAKWRAEFERGVGNSFAASLGPDALEEQLDNAEMHLLNLVNLSLKTVENKLINGEYYEQR